MVAPNMHIVDFRITRFQFARDRVIGDSQVCADDVHVAARSEEHTSELQSLMRISYAVFCLKKKKINNKKDIDQENKISHIKDIEEYKTQLTTNASNRATYQYY